MSLPTDTQTSPDGLLFTASGEPIFTEVHSGSRLRNLGDLLLTLPNYTVVDIDYEHPTGGVISSMRLMARDIPFGHESTSRTSRRFTHLGAGFEWFLAVEDTHRVQNVTLVGAS